MQTMTSRFQLANSGLPAFQFAGFSFPRYMAHLPKGSTVKRLERYRNPMTGPYYHAPKPNVNGQSFYLDSDGAPSLRWTWCDEVEGVGRGIDHTGWFSDEHCIGEKIRGLVFRLPHERGFLIGWSMGEGMCSTIETDYIYDDERTAAYAADSLAEDAAEKEREYQEAFDAEEGDDQ